jgi:hypothetical protein
MAKRTSYKQSYQKYAAKDIASWNFVIFLTLAFMLIVAVVTAMKNMAATNDYRTKAIDRCPATVTTCDKGKAVCFKGLDGCQRCVCSKK